MSDLWDIGLHPTLQPFDFARFGPGPTDSETDTYA
jgi:hypothetical protein